MEFSGPFLKGMKIPVSTFNKNGNVFKYTEQSNNKCLLDQLDPIVADSIKKKRFTRVLK